MKFPDNHFLRTTSIKNSYLMEEDIESRCLNIEYNIFNGRPLNIDIRHKFVDYWPNRQMV